ncbi:MAG: hypothetical protein LBQ54_02325 [Planctomycetaceae bacterium]|jgi:hypothetical protein|nr:hypothetical protein [Planctomycetaceae bacterium]
MRLKVIAILLTFWTVFQAEQDVRAQEPATPQPAVSPPESAAPDVSASNETIAKIKETFQAPPRDYSTGPLWTWNDLLTEEQIRSTMRDMASQHVKQVWVHPRPGLMTPYLSDDWFRLWGIALDEAEKLDMNVWIYDENSYPSGFAGGFVPEAMPESRGKGLHLQRVKELAAVDANIWYVFKVLKNETGAETFENVTAWAKEQGKLPEGDWLIGRIQFAGSGGWFGGWWYVDLLKKGVTEKFIEITMEPYRKRFGEQFGKRLPGWFTDEPHLQAAGGFTWNEEIPDAFSQKFGYSLIDTLPSLTAEVGDWKRVRHNYQQLLLDLFIERWAKPCHDYCEKYGLEFTGHYWEHGWPGAGHGPDNMAMYAWHQRPAIDTLMNQYNEGVNAQFGNARSVRELSSVANQLGKKRTLSETYGAGGWDLRFEDMKRIADWQYALGVNTTNEHLSYVTIRGARKRDHPQSFSYHSAWWEGYHSLADYHTRLSYALTRGEQINRVLVIEPTTTAWMYQGNKHLSNVGNDFQNFVNLLERWQVEYDLGSEDILARWGEVEDGKLLVGRRMYDLVILPPNMENINNKTLQLLIAYTQGAGSPGLVCCSLPERIDGSPQGMNIQKLLGVKTTVTTEDAAFSARMRTKKDGFQYHSPYIPDQQDTPILLTEEERTANPQGKVFHHRRQITDGELFSLCNIRDEVYEMVQTYVTNGEILFLCNTDMKEHAVGTVESGVKSVERWDPETGTVETAVESGMKSVERWDPETGKTEPYPYEVKGDSVTFHVDLPPCGSLLLFLGKTPAEHTQKRSFVKRVYQPVNVPKVKRLEPNVLTLDFVDVQVGKEVRENVYTYEANRWIWEKHGLGRNPWDNSVQFKDRLITKTFPDESGFSATYRFRLDGTVPFPLDIVMERADLYEITCNGKIVTAKEGEWWLDKSFGKVSITTAAQIGENEVTVTAKPMTMWHELEPAYLIGDFSLDTAVQGFVLKPSQTLTLKAPQNAEPGHSSAIEGVAWMSSGVGFTSAPGIASDRAPQLTFTLPAPYRLSHLKIWNYNETNQLTRGVKEFAVYGTSNPATLAEGIHAMTPLGTFTLVPGSSPGPQTLELDTRRPYQFLVFVIFSNHNGVTYPVAEGTDAEDNAFVGLSEIQFIADDILIPDVAVKPSSELFAASFDRRAVHLLDKSGLEPVELSGWKDQGMPFYSGKVAYTETFDLAEINKDCQYVVSLRRWYGSVAKVLVNGQEAGYIGHAPWECDVTKLVKSGKNEVCVEVIGTPKNLLGPHHNGTVRGTAWPGMFQKGPKNGQPSGRHYDLIGYGLFEPFVIKQIH